MRRIALLAAIAMGLASLALLTRYQDSFEERVSGGEAVSVLVTTIAVPLGEMVTEEMLAIREIPESYIDSRHIRATEVDKAIGIRTTNTLRAEEVMLWTDLAVSSQERRVLSGLVTQGMRAITVRVERGSSLSSMLRPGDRIDLLLRASKEGGPVVLPILQNVMVLAVGNDLGASTTTQNIFDSISSSADLTLSVTIEQAQALTLAQGEGELSASLRNPNDIIVNADSPVTTTASIHLAEKRAALQLRNPRRQRTNLPKAREIEHVD